MTRRRFRFGLRSLFVVVTVVAIWCSYAVNWIRQRAAVVRQGRADRIWWTAEAPPTAPSGLWLLGEVGYGAISVNELPPGEQERIIGLFPEAQLIPEPPPTPPY